LTIIPGGVKSKLCIVSGGRTLWANFYNAIFLICFLFFGKTLINLIPYSALAAILIHTGYKMCEPRIWRHVAHIGPEQLFLYVTTILVTLSTDLLIGIFVGTLAKMVLVLVFSSTGLRSRAGRPLGFFETARLVLGNLGLMFRNPVVRRETVDGVYHLYFDRPIVCSNSLHLNRELDQIPAEAADVVLHFGNNVAMIDHTSCDSIFYFVEEHARSGRGHVELVGLSDMRAFSHHQACMRLSRPMLPAATTTPFHTVHAEGRGEPALHGPS
jgi:MFS superfamily sulfate permease-like transporter